MSDPSDPREPDEAVPASSAERELARMKNAPGAAQAIAELRALQAKKDTPVPLRAAPESEKAEHVVIEALPAGAKNAPAHDTIQDINPLAGKWKAEDRRDTGPI